MKCPGCYKTLTNPESIAKGIGPICEAKMKIGGAGNSMGLKINLGSYSKVTGTRWWFIDDSRRRTLVKVSTAKDGTRIARCSRCFEENRKCAHIAAIADADAERFQKEEARD